MSGRPIEGRTRSTHMGAMPLQAISLLLHAFVGWRLVPALGSVPAGAALALVLALSALTLPCGLGARRGGGGFALALAWTRACWHGPLLVAVRAHAAARRRRCSPACALAAVRRARRPGGAPAPRSALAVPLLAAARHAVGLRQRAPHARAVVGSTCRSPDLPAALHGFTIAQISDIHVGPTIKRGYVEAHRRRGQRARRRHDRRSPATWSTAASRELGDARRAAGAAALAPRHLLRHRQPRVLLGRARLGRRAAPARAARCC